MREVNQISYKISVAAKAAGVCPKTIRKWLKLGLPFSRMPTGTVLIRPVDLDAFVSQFKVSDRQIQNIVDGMMEKLTS